METKELNIIYFKLYRPNCNIANLKVEEIVTLHQICSPLTSDREAAEREGGNQAKLNCTELPLLPLSAGEIFCGESEKTRRFSLLYSSCRARDLKKATPSRIQIRDILVDLEPLFKERTRNSISVVKIEIQDWSCSDFKRFLPTICHLLADTVE
ncbi:hypothetical protein IMY05_004G0125000 [Salix suchowensis]|nr:hypothetical protein IMY05_004G0125000 [Salix suchowensis]